MGPFRGEAGKGWLRSPSDEGELAQHEIETSQGEVGGGAVGRWGGGAAGPLGRGQGAMGRGSGWAGGSDQGVCGDALRGLDWDEHPRAAIFPNEGELA